MVTLTIDVVFLLRSVHSGLFGTTKPSNIELADEMRKKQELVRLVR